MLFILHQSWSALILYWYSIRYLSNVNQTSPSYIEIRLQERRHSDKKNLDPCTLQKKAYLTLVFCICEHNPIGFSCSTLSPGATFLLVCSRVLMKIQIQIQIQTKIKPKYKIQILASAQEQHSYLSLQHASCSRVLMRIQILNTNTNKNQIQIQNTKSALVLPSAQEQHSYLSAQQ